MASGKGLTMVMSKPWVQQGMKTSAGLWLLTQGEVLCLGLAHVAQPEPGHDAGDRTVFTAVQNCFIFSVYLRECLKNGIHQVTFQFPFSKGKNQSRRILIQMVTFYTSYINACWLFIYSAQ